MVPHYIVFLFAVSNIHVCLNNGVFLKGTERNGGSTEVQLMYLLSSLDQDSML